MEVLLIVITTIYVVFIFQLCKGFNSIKTYKTTPSITPKTSFTILVPFRNEAKNLPRLLKSFSKLNYPHELIEIIFIDDESIDNSAQLVTNWRMNHDTIDTTMLENLRLSKSPKKDAINRAIHIVKNTWIITTDADCKVPANWLKTIDDFIQNQSPKMIVAPVDLSIKNNWFHLFQSYDHYALQSTTIGSFGINKPFMCNGANFAYTKEFFQSLGGFQNNTNFASGDDVFLLQKAIQSSHDSVQYLKNTDATVSTKPVNDFFDWFFQRVRWASKSGKYTTSYPKFLALIVFSINLLLVCCTYLAIKHQFSWIVLLLSFITKYFIDLILINKFSSFIRKNFYKIPLTSSILLPVFYSFIGLAALLGTYTWKKRKLK